MIIAHRGGRFPGVSPTDLFSNMKAAIGWGADFVELDLRETADGKIVIYHDAQVRELDVSKAPLSELKERALATKVTPPIELSTALETFGNQIGWDLEVKVPGLERRIRDLLAKTAVSTDRVIFKSFEDVIVHRLKQAFPDTPCGLLLGVAEPKFGPLTRISELFPGWRLRRSKADFAAPNWQLVKFGFAARRRSEELPLYVWTLNDLSLIENFWHIADAIITDYPSLCDSLLGQSRPSSKRA